MAQHFEGLALAEEIFEVRCFVRCCFRNGKAIVSDLGEFPDAVEEMRPFEGKTGISAHQACEAIRLSI